MGPKQHVLLSIDWGGAGWAPNSSGYFGEGKSL